MAYQQQYQQQQQPAYQQPAPYKVVPGAQLIQPLNPGMRCELNGEKESCQFFCPSCNAIRSSKVTKKKGNWNWICCLGLAFFTGIFWVAPCCCGCCTDVDSNCNQCGLKVGRYEFKPC